MTEIDPQDLRAQVQNWLLGEGWQLTEKPHEDALWLLEAQDAGGRIVVVGQKRGKTDQVLLEAAVALTDNHRERFERLAAAERQELLWDMRFRLLQMGVEFQGAQEPLVRVVIGHRLYLDGIGQDRFLGRVARVRNAVIAVIWTIARHLHLGPGDTGPGETRVN